MPKHSREQIIQTLQNLSVRLGTKKLSTKDVAQAIPLSVVNGYFGSTGKALEAAGLESTPPGENLRGRQSRISDEDLFRALLEVERKLGKEPGFNDCLAHGEYSRKPYKRFGKWPEVMAFYRKWKASNSIVGKGAPPVTSVLAVAEEAKEIPVLIPSQKIKSKAPAQYYGELINFRGLRHAPINEQMVVFLFGMVNQELGFVVDLVQQGFPDCKGMFREKGRLAEVRIEFEYKASSFKEAGHDPDQCDFIVCWENDWPNCPIDVIELKTEILKLPAK